jgi:hypothetical protein
MKQEVDPSLVHVSYINLQLRTQYPYFDLCKVFVSLLHLGVVT